MSYTSYMSHMSNGCQENSWCPPLVKPRPLAGFGVVVGKLLSIIGLRKVCAAGVPDFAVHYAVQLYRKVPHSTAKRVKKNGPESAADYRKVMANITIPEVDEAPGKMFLPKCTAKSGTTGRVSQALMAKNEIFLKVPGTSHLRTPWAAGTCQSGIQYLKSNV